MVRKSAHKKWRCSMCSSCFGNISSPDLIFERRFDFTGIFVNGDDVVVVQFEVDTVVAVYEWKYDNRCRLGRDVFTVYGAPRWGSVWHTPVHASLSWFLSTASLRDCGLGNSDSLLLETDGDCVGSVFVVFVDLYKGIDRESVYRTSQILYQKTPADRWIVIGREK